jgi:hypothetical protein
MIGKTALALAVVGLVGVAISLGSDLRHRARDEELMFVAYSIADALEDVNRFPGEVKLLRHLPRIRRDFKIVVSGTWSEGVETIVVDVMGEVEVRHSFAIGCRVNEGNFVLSASNPGTIRVMKNQGEPPVVPDFRALLTSFLLKNQMENLGPPPPELSLELM